MTEKTIKSLYKQPVNYKLIREGYKTINGVINAQDGMPKTLDLPTPSVIYNSDLQYAVDDTKNGAPIINFSSFTLPDDETCEAKQYCYAPKGINYDYKSKEIVRHYDNFTIVGSPTITNDTIVSGFSVSNRLQLVNMPIYSAGTITSFEFMFKIHTPETFTPNGRLLNDFNSYDDVKLEVYSTGMAFNYGTSSTYIYTTSTPISTNTDYWIRVMYSNGTMSLDYSTDGINYSVAASAEIASSNIQILSSTFDIGARYYGNQDPGCTWAGSIDLSQTYIKINGGYYWLPYRDVLEEIITPIPGIMDSSVTVDNWQQNQTYKLYQLKNQSNSNVLQLTENNITNSSEKYKQYIQQITIPARDYKWYYHNIETGVYNNYNVVGSPNVNKETGVASGFSSTSYLQLPEAFNPGNNPWEMIIKIRTGSDLQTWQEIFHSSVAPNDSGRYGVSILIYSGNFELDISIDGSSWIGTDRGTFVLSEYTNYWLKVGWNSNEYYLEYSTNGVDYIRDITYTSSNHLPSLTNSWIGIYRNDNYAYPMLGTIDLSESEIKMNGNLWWSPMSTEDEWIANKSIYDYSTIGSYADILDFTKSYIGVNDSEYHKYANPKVCLMPINGGETVTEYVQNGNLVGNVIFNKYTGELNNFSTSNYVTLPAIFDPSNNSWEMIFKFNSGTIGTSKGIFAIDTYYSLVLGFKNKLCIWTSSDGSSWSSPDMDDNGLTTLSNNTDYYVKATYSNNTLTVYLSTDKTTWTTEYTQNISLAAVSSNFSKLGLYRAGGSPLDTGSIDLKECQIRINDQIWWNGIESTTELGHQYMTLFHLPNNCTMIGNISIDPYGVVSGFSNNDYIEVENNTDFGTNDYEIICKFRISNSIYDKSETIIRTEQGFILGIQNNGDTGHTNKFYSNSYYDGGWKTYTRGTSNLSLNTWYYVKVTRINGVRNVYLSTDKINWNLESTTSDNHYYSSAKHLIFGNNLSGSNDLTDGEIDLGECTIVLNGNIILDGKKYTWLPGCLYNYIDDGSAHSFDVYYDSQYTQPILVNSGQSYANGTKVDTITIPAHTTWNYTSGGTWTQTNS